MDTDDSRTTGKNVLLVAGGVGINPLISIIMQLKDSGSNVRSCLMYSAKTADELLFKVSAILSIWVFGFV